MGGFISRREPQVLHFLAAHRGMYVRFVQMPRGIGIGVLSSLIDKGLVATGPATIFPRERGYAITPAGLHKLKELQTDSSRLELLHRMRLAQRRANING